jgi:hypothetical protein
MSKQVISGRRSCSPPAYEWISLGLPYQSTLTYCDGLGDTSDVTAATQCLQAERIFPWLRVHREAATEAELLSSHSNALRYSTATQQFLTVKFPKQPNCCDGRYNREKIYLLFQTQTLDLSGRQEEQRKKKKTKVLILNKYMAMGSSGARCQEWPCWLVAGSKLLLCSDKKQRREETGKDRIDSQKSVNSLSVSWLSAFSYLAVSIQEQIDRR